MLGDGPSASTLLSFLLSSFLSRPLSISLCRYVSSALSFFFPLSSCELLSGAQCLSLSASQVSACTSPQ